MGLTRRIFCRCCPVNIDGFKGIGNVLYFLGSCIYTYGEAVIFLLYTSLSGAFLCWRLVAHPSTSRLQRIGGRVRPVIYPWKLFLTTTQHFWSNDLTDQMIHTQATRTLRNMPYASNEEYDNLTLRKVSHVCIAAKITAGPVTFS